MNYRMSFKLIFFIGRVVHSFVFCYVYLVELKEELLWVVFFAILPRRVPVKCHFLNII